MKVKTLEELVNEGALEGKRVFIRADMNVPRDAEGNIKDFHKVRPIPQTQFDGMSDWTTLGQNDGY